MFLLPEAAFTLPLFPLTRLLPPSHLGLEMQSLPTPQEPKSTSPSGSQLENHGVLTVNL